METKETLRKKIQKQEIEIQKRDEIISRQSNGHHIIDNLKSQEYTENYNESNNRIKATIIFIVVIIFLFNLLTKNS